MTPLEHRYRRVLRLLPADYRRDWEEDMVQTFLDAAEDERDDDSDDELAGHRHPTMGEVAAVTALAVRLRVGAPATVGASARSVTWGEALRRVALLGLLVPAALVLSEMLGALGHRLMVTPPPGAAASTAGPVLGDLLPQLGWVLAFLALAGGWRWAALVVAPATWVAVVLLWVVEALGSNGVFAGTLTVEAVALAVPVLALVAWHDDATPPSRGWLLALPGAVVVIGVVSVLAYLGFPVLWDRPGLLCLAVAVAAVVVRVRDRRHPGQALPWSLALAVLAPVAAVWRAVFVVELLPYVETLVDLQLLAASSAQAVAAVVVTAASWLFTLRHLAARQAPARS